MRPRNFALRKLSDNAEITFSADLLVGRNPDNNLRLIEGKPSDKHALLSLFEGSVWVHDLNSTNGTYVNDKRITSKVKLQSKDRLRFDIEEFEFQVSSVVANGSHTDAPQQERGTDKRREPPAWIEINRGDDDKTRLVPSKELEQHRANNRKGLPGRQVDGMDAPRLIFSGDSDEPTHIQLRVVQSWMIGSDTGCDIRLQDISVSGRHAKIVTDEKKWTLIDLGSANGTFVNGMRTPIRFLNANDQIAFGAVACDFHLPLRAAAEIPTPSHPGSRYLPASLYALIKRFRKSRMKQVP